VNLEQKIQLLMDEREIIRLVNRFDITTNEGDLKGFSELWTEDAVWEISKPIYSNGGGGFKRDHFGRLAGPMAAKTGALKRGHLFLDVG